MNLVASTKAVLGVAADLGLAVSLRSGSVEIGVLYGKGCARDASPDLRAWRISDATMRVETCSADGEAWAALIRG